MIDIFQNPGGGKTTPLSKGIMARSWTVTGCLITGRWKTGLFFCAFFVGVLGASPVLYAEEKAVTSPPTTETVQIVTDQDKGTITFMIDGKAVVQINRDGLHVVESINYGGVLTDTGSAHVEKIIAGDGHAE
jgi:hypothetical protein